jgi:hypothetical protein
MNNTYTPELGVTEELNEIDMLFFQELIVTIQWAFENGSVNILLEVSLLSQYQSSPREGDFKQLLHIIAFVQKHPKLTFYLSQELPNMDYGEFRTNKADFAEIYRDADEDLPHSMSVLRGWSVIMTAFIDASHAANK